jgi:hypothetical protein
MAGNESSLGEQPPTKEVNPLDDVEFEPAEEENDTTLPKPDTSPGGLEPLREESEDTGSETLSLGERLKRAREKSQVRDMSEESESEPADPADLEPEEPTGFPTLGEDTERALDEAVHSATASSEEESERRQPAPDLPEDEDEADEPEEADEPSTPPPMPGRTSPADTQRKSAAEEPTGGPQRGAEELVLEDDEGDEDDDLDNDVEPEVEAVEEAPAQQTPPSRRTTSQEQDSGGAVLWLGTLAVAAGLLIIAGVGYVYLSSPSADGSDRSSQAKGRATADPAQGGEATKAEPGLDEAIGAAQQTLDRALAVDPNATETQLQAARRLTDGEHWKKAAAVWTHLWDQGDRASIFDRSTTTTYLDALEGAGRHAQLRRVALDASQRFAEGDAFAQRFRASIDADPELGNTDPVQLESLAWLTSIADPGGPDMPGLALRDESGEVTRVFLPQRRWQNAGRHWRDAVATWRLCTILPCGFQVPKTQPAQVKRSTLETLASPHLKSLSEAAGKSFVWTEADGEDVLRGALMEWPGALKRWPIEAFEVWRPWLDADAPASNLETPIEEAFAPFADIADGYDAAAISGARDASLRDIARQLSRLLLTDYLLNNWGRFASQSEDFGSRNHIADGRFVTVRTDTAFQLRNSTRVKGRFRWTSRFSRDAIDAIDLLERGDLADHLFPKTRAVERNKMEIFWDQRDRALQRVDALVGQHGRDPVFVFE